MIGLLQSGTGSGNGRCLPIASSGSLARGPTLERRAAFAPGVARPLAAALTPCAELTGAPAPLGPRALCDGEGPRRAPLRANLRLVALPAGRDPDAAAALEPTAAAVAVVPWPAPDEDVPPAGVPETPPPGLVGVLVRGTSVGVPLGSLGVETVTGGVDTLTGGVDTLISGVFAVTVGVDTVTEGIDALSPGVETVTDGVDTVTPGSEPPTPGSETPTPDDDTPTPGSDTPTLGNETPSGAALCGDVLVPCSNPAWALAEPPTTSARATPISDALSAIRTRLERRVCTSVTAACDVASKRSAHLNQPPPAPAAPPRVRDRARSSQ